MAPQSKAPQISATAEMAPSAGSTGMAAEAALVQSAPDAVAGPATLAVNARASRIPIEVDVAVPVRGFRVRDLLNLQEGRVIESLWVPGEDLPLAARGAQLAWSEFEVIDQKIAVRITRVV